MLLSRTEQWLRDGDKPAGTTLAAFDGEEPVLAKGEDILGTISSLRDGAKQLQAKRKRIESAPYPSAFCKAQAKAEVEA
jgi:hypothetical protein